MTKEELIELLRTHGSEQTARIYRNHGAKGEVLGVKFADFQKIRKSIISDDKKKGFNHALALDIWDSEIHDARIFATMIAEPAKANLELIDKWALESDCPVIADSVAHYTHHTSFKDIKRDEWINSTSEFTRRMGYAIIAQDALYVKDLPNEYFVTFVDRIVADIHSSANFAKEGMNSCLIAIGARLPALRDIVLVAAKEIGTVVIDHGNTNCQTLVIEDYLRKVYKRKEHREKKL